MSGCVLITTAQIAALLFLTSIAWAQEDSQSAQDSVAVSSKLPARVSIEVIGDSYGEQCCECRRDWFCSMVQVDSITILLGACVLSVKQEHGYDPAIVDLIFSSGGRSESGEPRMCKAVRTLEYPTAQVCVAEPPDSIRQSQPDKYGEFVIRASGPTKLAEHIYSTGPIGETDPAQGLVIETANGIVVICGCASPGIGRIVRAAKKYLNREVLLVAGGFHMEYDDYEMAQEVTVLKGLGVTYVAPVHCTGPRGRAALKEAYGDHFIEIGVGDKLDVASLKIH